jgi:hypothetical protein
MKPETTGGVYRGGIKNRRARALARLEAQLVSKVKPNREKLAGSDVNVPLTELDIKRINKEVGILKNR